MDQARAAGSLARIQDEIASEKAAALSRIACTLEALVAELHRLAAGAGEPAGRRGGGARFRQVREQALRWRWYLEVQREALGLTWHEELDALYPIPDVLCDRTDAFGGLRGEAAQRR